MIPNNYDYYYYYYKITIRTILKKPIYIYIYIFYLSKFQSKRNFKKQTTTTSRMLKIKIGCVFPFPPIQKVPHFSIYLASLLCIVRLYKWCGTENLKWVFIQWRNLVVFINWIANHGETNNLEFGNIESVPNYLRNRKHRFKILPNGSLYYYYYYIITNCASLKWECAIIL